MLRKLCVPVVLSAPLLLLGCKTEAPPPSGTATAPPVVKVARPVEKDVTDYEDFTGRMDALKSVDVRAQVTGQLLKINFTDGSEVKEGQVLFEIDPQMYEAARNQARANLRQAQVHLDRLNRDFRRAQDLLPLKSISQEEYDKIAGDRDEAEQAVGVAQANLKTAAINLGYAKVTAPISGRVSRRYLDIGNMVKANDTSLTRINYLDEMYVYFDINERTFIRLQRLVKEGKIPTSAENRAKVLLRLADEKEYSRTGTIDFEDNQLDVKTGTFRMRAVVPNRDRFYAPGLFVRVRLPVGRPHRAVLVAEQALATDQGQKFVWVLKDKIDPETKKVVPDPKTHKPAQVAEYRPVEVGRQHEGLREITKGLKPDEWVIVSGLQRVRPGADVNPERLKELRRQNLLVVGPKEGGDVHPERLDQMPAVAGNPRPPVAPLPAPARAPRKQK